MSEWKVPRGSQPRPEDYNFDLDEVLAAVAGLHSQVPADAFTADTLGTERAGSAVLIRDSGLFATIGYLVTEAESLWLTMHDGRVIPGDVITVDQETGLGLVQALGPVEQAALRIGSSGETEVGDSVILAGAGGRHRSVAAHIVAKQEFAGYWEYLLEDAIFTAPGHPNWGGTALIGDRGELLGIGSLQLQHERSGATEPINMVVPIDLLAPMLEDITSLAASQKPARPWLGFYAAELDSRIAVADVARGGPAEAAGMQPGDLILAVGQQEPRDLASLFRLIWKSGPAGTRIPLRIFRSGQVLELSVASTDRRKMLRRPRLH